MTWDIPHISEGLPSTVSQEQFEYLWQEPLKVVIGDETHSLPFRSQGFGRVETSQKRKGRSLHHVLALGNLQAAYMLLASSFREDSRNFYRFQ